MQSPIMLLVALGALAAAAPSEYRPEKFADPELHPEKYAEPVVYQYESPREENTEKFDEKFIGEFEIKDDREQQEYPGEKPYYINELGAPYFPKEEGKYEERYGQPRIYEKPYEKPYEQPYEKPYYTGCERPFYPQPKPEEPYYPNFHFEDYEYPKKYSEEKKEDEEQDKSIEHFLKEAYEAGFGSDKGAKYAKEYGYVKHYNDDNAIENSAFEDSAFEGPKERGY